MPFNEEAEQALDEYTEELTEARREEAIIFYEGCTIVTAPTGPAPEYLVVEVDTINDYNIMWRGVPPTPAVGDEVIVWENPLSHRREIWGGSGATGITSGVSWCQVVVVAKCGGDFDDITDAIAWINALAAPPAAGLLFVLYVLAGNWIEGANVTVPPFVTLRGMGDGTSIEMGAFDLIMDDDSNLFDVKVTFAASGSLLISSKDRVILEHVHGTQTSNDDVLFVDGTSVDIECKDCHFESAGDEAVYVKDTSDARFDNCKFEAHAGAGYAFVLGDTATVRMEWCELTAYVPVFTVAGTTFNHFSCQFDLSASTLAAGSHTALSSKRFNQTLIVAEAGGEFTSLGAAITYINAQADAAAGKLYGVLMLDGNYAEAATQTIPSYVHVMGKGEGTEIEMAANQQLVLASYSSLMDVVVEGSPGAANEVIYTNNVTDVLLRNVKAINGSAVGYCFGFAGSSVVKCHHCVAETSTANAIGFNISGTSDVFLKDCHADDTTNFLAALFFTDTACSAETHDCTFRGNNDDVNVAAAAIWEHIACNVDAQNVTITGTSTPLEITPVNLDGWADALILDADGDTTISAPTDDQIDIEIAGTDYGELIERVLGWDEVVDVGTWYDFKLVDAAEGDHFRQNAATFPAGWVEADAAAATDTNSKYSFWLLQGSNAEVSWDYRKQTGITIESLAASFWASFLYGPILFRDGQYTADLDYYFAIHGETAGAIDLTEYVRVHLQWNSIGAGWRVRGESDQGAGQTASGWTTLNPGPLHQPLFFRLVIRNDANNNTREYMGTTPDPRTDSVFQTVQEPTTWGQVYWRIHQTRGAGAVDYLLIGAVDYLGNRS